MHVDFKRILNLIFLILLIGLAFGILYYIFFMISNEKIQIISVVLFCLFLIALIKISRNNRKSISDTYSHIKKLVLISLESEDHKEWDISGMTSVLIGKCSKETFPLDVDLIDTIYSDYISEIHAVLNYSYGYWYIEDLESRNGVGIRKHHDEYALRVKPLTPYLLKSGDILYIGKTKLLVL